MERGRVGEAERITAETRVRVKIELDGVGRYEISTGFSFFDHMLSLFTYHGLFNLELSASGDDLHHTIEDVGICLGRAISHSLGERRGINRYGFCLLPMDESLISVAVDFSGRPLLIYNVSLPKEVNYPKEVFDEFFAYKEFFKSLATSSNLTLHINFLYGENIHHILEGIFKGVGRAISQATRLNPRISDIPSTKGKLNG
jgi:imidazoleglycerol-phosphate dehydratase